MKRGQLRMLMLSILVFPMTGCVHHWPQEVVGQRKDAQGIVSQQIIRESSYVDYPALTPDGRNNKRVITNKYFILEKDKPKRKFWVGDSYIDPYLQGCLPITNSDLWISLYDDLVWTNRPIAAHVGVDDLGKTYTSYIGNDLHVYIFDTKGFFLQRLFIVVQAGEGMSPDNAKIPKFPHEAKIETQNGNRIVTFQSVDGFKQYDVVADKVTNLETNSVGQK